MVLPLWGSLEKAQDDDETIEQAITRLILEHEADPTAHLGSGESLEQHKTSEVIDHPAGSVLADKQTTTEIVFNLVPGSGGVFTVTGLTAITGMNLIRLSTEEAGTQQSKATVLASFGITPFSNNRDSLFQTTVYFDFAGDDSCEVYFGVTNNTTPGSSGYGFFCEETTIKGFARFGSTTYYTSAFSVSDLTKGLYRAQYVASENQVYFFKDGERVGTLTHATDSLTAGTYFAFYIDGNGDTGSVLYFLDLFASGSIITV